MKRPGKISFISIEIESSQTSANSKKSSPAWFTIKNLISLTIDTLPLIIEQRHNQELHTKLSLE